MPLITVRSSGTGAATVFSGCATAGLAAGLALVPGARALGAGRAVGAAALRSSFRGFAGGASLASREDALCFLGDHQKTRSSQRL